MKNKPQASNVEKITDKDQIKIIQSYKGEEFKDYRRKYDESVNYDEKYNILDFPITVTLEMINKCNLKCVMCYTDHHKKIKSTLGMDELDKFLEECKKFKAPAIIIGLGSEVLMYKGIKEVVKNTAHSFVATLLLVVLSVVAAIAAGYFVENNFLSLLLSYCPGGIYEVAVIAIAFDLDPNFVAFHHIIRLLMILFISSSFMLTSISRSLRSSINSLHIIDITNFPIKISISLVPLY